MQEREERARCCRQYVLPSSVFPRSLPHENLDAEIEQETRYRPELRIVDLADFYSVNEVALSFDGEPLDILVLNAAVALMEYAKTKDGWEQT